MHRGALGCLGCIGSMQLVAQASQCRASRTLPLRLSRYLFRTNQQLIDARPARPGTGSAGTVPDATGPGPRAWAGGHFSCVCMHARLLARASALLHVPRSRPPWCRRLRVTSSVGGAGGGLLIRSAGSSGGSMLPRKGGKSEREAKKEKLGKISLEHAEICLK